MFSTLNEEELGKYNQLVEKYKKLSEKLRIKKEIDQLNLEIEKLKVREELEESDFSKEIQGLRVRLEVLQEERDEDTSKSVELIANKTKINLISVRLSKLEEKRESISENVYNKLKQEYEAEINDLTSYINKEKALIEDLYEKSKEFLNNYSALKEELDIRMNLSDFSETEYQRKIEDLKEAKSSAESLFEITELLLEELTS